ncbi:uncharacterized protein [Eurosta solidaginis]|uniref:uncharacterized protein isoform X1 n=1 Tax=Eurosta solidaginis TaxID=178769 RepID=UPI0035314975
MLITNLTTTNGTVVVTPNPYNFTTSSNDVLLTTITISSTNQNVPWQYSTTQPEGSGIIITDNYWYWSGLYYFFFWFIVVITIGSVAVCLAIQKRLPVHQLKARQRAHAISQGNASNNGSGSTPPGYPASTETAMPSTDGPPTYETAMRNYIDAKQKLRDIEENAMDGMTMAASTTTIETCISEVDLSTTVSAGDFAAMRDSVTNTSPVIEKHIQQ